MKELCPNQGEPPPAAGEVAELVEWLMGHAAHADQALGSPIDAAMFIRVRDLLQRQQPQPVPVSERLPGPEDCDEMGRCWWYEDTEDCCGVWSLDIFDHEYTHWISAHALPLPS